MENKCNTPMNLCFVPFTSGASAGHIARPGGISNVIGMHQGKKIIT